MREIVLDIETTGLLIGEGHRILEIAAIEMEGHKPTGREFYALINPDRDIPPDNSKIHGITQEKVAGKPLFAAIAKELKDFIGDDPIIITCRTKDGYTLDVEFLNMELKKAGLEPPQPGQWLNVRRWSEAMFGNDNATLNKVLDHYKVDRSERDLKGHGAALDARLLSVIYSDLLKDYARFLESQKKSAPNSKQSPPTI